MPPRKKADETGGNLVGEAGREKNSELAKIRRICLGIAGTVEKLSHGEPTWFTGPKGKVFAMFDNHHHGAEHISVWIPTSIVMQQMLVRSEPARYWIPPYVGKKGWVAVILDTNPNWAEVAELINDAFSLIVSPA